MAYGAKIYLTIFIIILLVVGILGYTYYSTKDIIDGPQITIETPLNGATIDESLVKIVGSTKNISKITLNDRAIFIDEFGSIEENVLLSYGYNLLTLRAEDRFGRVIIKTLELVYK